MREDIVKRKVTNTIKLLFIFIIIFFISILFHKKILLYISIVLIILSPFISLYITLKELEKKR